MTETVFSSSILTGKVSRMPDKSKEMPRSGKKLPEYKASFKKPPATTYDVTNKIRADLVRELQDTRKQRRSQDFENNRERKQSSSAASHGKLNMRPYTFIIKFEDRKKISIGV